jgi:hypothetical protein
MASIATAQAGQAHQLTLTVGRKGKAGLGHVKGGVA